jgi:hypothetical protein
VSFWVPYLTRRVAQSAWEGSASVCSSSAVAYVVCKPLGRVSLDAHVDEQRRKQADARVPFLLVSFLWARKEKTLAEGRKKIVKSSEELPITARSATVYLFLICLFAGQAGCHTRKTYLTNRVVPFRVPYLTRRVAQAK